MGCATGIVKFLLFLFNFVFVVGGIGLIAVGALFITGYSEYDDILPELQAYYQFPPILMMVVGGIVFFIAFMGCCGAVRENKCMMMTYATVLLILLVAELVIFGLLFWRQDEFKTTLKNGLIESSQKYYESEQIREAWDSMQKNLECCGVNGPQDWPLGKIPASCCKAGETCTDSVTQILSLSIGSSKIYNEGCVDKFFGTLKTEYGMYGAAILAAVELLGVIFGCCLGARFGRKTYHT